MSPEFDRLLASGIGFSLLVLAFFAATCGSTWATTASSCVTRRSRS
jgi:hypothetical protein